MSQGIYWIDGPWPGRLAILARPRGGDWLRDDVQTWRRANLNLVVSTLTRPETEEWNLENEPQECEAEGIEYISIAIPDRQVPASRRAVVDLVRLLNERLENGKNVGIHCRAGLGRSPLLAACTLINAGFTPAEALERITATRGVPVPETTEQRFWVERFAEQPAPVEL